MCTWILFILKLFEAFKSWKMIYWIQVQVLIAVRMLVYERKIKIPWNRNCLGVYTHNLGMPINVAAFVISFVNLTEELYVQTEGLLQQNWAKLWRKNTVSHYFFSICWKSCFLLWNSRSTFLDGVIFCIIVVYICTSKPNAKEQKLGA